MNSQAELRDRIWTIYQLQRRRRTKIVRLGLGFGIGCLAIGGVLWPQAAFALQDVEKATQDFNTVRWTQHDEGVIRDMGSPDPKRVPYYSSTRQHFVSRKPLDIRENWDTWNEWRGIQQTVEPVKVRVGGKTIVQKLLTQRSQRGASHDLRPQDIDMALSSFSFLAFQWDPLRKRYREAALGASGWIRNDQAVYGGRSVVGFAYRHLYGKNEVALTLYADPKSKRMVFYRLEYFAPDKSRIYLRTLTGIRYDEPAP